MIVMTKTICDGYVFDELVKQIVGDVGKLRMSLDIHFRCKS